MPSEELESSFSIEGAWRAKAVVAGIPGQFPYMDIYTPDSNSQGLSGTVLCTQPSGNFWSPALEMFVLATVSGHGSWVRTVKNKFAFTVWRILLNAETSQPVGNAQFWGTVSLQTNDTFTGTINAAYYDQNGTVLNRFQGTSTGARIAVEVEGQ